MVYLIKQEEFKWWLCLTNAQVLKLDFHIQSTDTTTCFDLHIILREMYIKQAYIKHRWIMNKIKTSSIHKTQMNYE